MATIRRQTGPNINEFRDFRVRKTIVTQWLLFFKRNKRSYYNIIIDNDLIDILPENANIYHLIPTILTTSEIDVHQISSSFHNENDEIDGGIENGSGQLNDYLNEEEQGIRESLISLPLNQTTTESENFNNYFTNEINNVINWPQPNKQASCEFNTPNLLSDTWPHLFPIDVGDITNHNRLFPVTLHDSIIHYIKFAYQNSTGKWIYPFMIDRTFIMYIQNMDERHRIMTQANVYLKNNVGEANYTMQDLQNSNILQTIRLKMHKYGANVLGSSAHLYRERIKLEELNKQLGCATIWMTLSYADMHWNDLHKLFGEPPPNTNINVSHHTFIQSWKHQCIQDNPHIVDAFFVKRVETFIEEFLGANGLEATWAWYRYEWQSRGAIHAHLLAKLASDPGISSMSIEVFNGRKFARMLRAYRLTHPVGYIFNRDTIKDSIDTEQHPEDVFLIPWDTLLQSSLIAEDLSDDIIVQYEAIIERGKYCEDSIIQYRDYILTSINPASILPTDATAEVRLPKETFNGKHAAENCHLEQNDNNFLVNYDNYTDLIQQCYRHRCTLDYCLKKGSCRFKFPQKLRSHSTIYFIESNNKVIAKFSPATNDRWINSHCPSATAAWGGMVDLQIIIDKISLIHYIAKYGTKLETTSKGHNEIMKTILRKGQENESSTKTILRSAFIKTLGNYRMFTYCKLLI